MTYKPNYKIYIAPTTRFHRKATEMIKYFLKYWYLIGLDADIRSITLSVSNTLGKG